MSTNEEKIDKVVNAKPKNERIAFSRKQKKLLELVESLAPIEEKIQKIIIEEKYPIMDEIKQLKATMDKECVHPKDHLVIQTEDDCTFVLCKFCNVKMAVS